MKPYSKDLRLKVLAAVDRGMPKKEVARVFGVSEPTIRRHLQLRRETGEVEPKPPKGPRNRGKNTTLLASMSVRGMGPCLTVEGAMTKVAFETYVEQVLVPSLRA